MKKIFILLSFCLLLVGCGTGNFAKSTGLTDMGYMMFVSQKQIDGAFASIDDAAPVKIKVLKKTESLNKRTKNMIPISVGTHALTIKDKNGNILWNQKVFISTQETKEIEI